MNQRLLRQKKFLVVKPRTLGVKSYGFGLYCSGYPRLRGRKTPTLGDFKPQRFLSYLPDVTGNLGKSSHTRCLDALRGPPHQEGV